MPDREWWKKWAADKREAQFFRTATVQVKSAADLDGLKAGALADPAKFALWPLRLQVPPFHAEWYRLSQLYKTDPKYRKVLILAATGFGKTTAWNLAVPLYEIAKDRAIQVGLVGNNLDNTKQKLRTITHQLTGNKDLIHAFGYPDPDDGIPRFKPKGKEKWSTTEVVVAGAAEAAYRQNKVFDNPTLAVFGWESGMEGRHWDLAICDDAIDYMEAQSPLRREQYLDWYLNIFKRRMNPEGREVWIGTRAHAADLYQYMIDSGEYVVINLPQALEWDTEGHEVSTWPEQWPTEQLLEERARDPVSFMLKRMNQIAGKGLTEFPHTDVLACQDADLRYYGNIQNLPQPMREKNLMIYAGVDLAVGTTAESKYFAFTVVGADRHTGDRYILDIVRGKFGTADQRQKVRERYAAWLPTKVLVENNGTQRYFFEDSFEGLPIYGINTGNNKVSLDEGIPSLVSLVKAHKLHIPWEDAHSQVISKVFVKELEDYPKGETSDVVMSWWFAEREIRSLFMVPAKVVQTRNFFRRGGRVQIRRPGGWAHGERPLHVS